MGRWTKYDSPQRGICLSLTRPLSFPLLSSAHSLFVFVCSFWWRVERDFISVSNDVRAPGSHMWSEGQGRLETVPSADAHCMSDKLNMTVGSPITTVPGSTHPLSNHQCLSHPADPPDEKTYVNVPDVERQCLFWLYRQKVINVQFCTECELIV